MVSLGQPGRNIRTGGGHFFNYESDLLFDAEDSSIESHVPLIKDEPIYRRIPTTAAIIIELILTVLLFVALFIVPHNVETRTACFIIYCTHSTLWCVFFGINIFLYYQHRMIYRHGYLEFFRRTRILQVAPIFIVSGGNTLLLLSSSFVYEYCFKNDDSCPEGSLLTCSGYAQIILGLECILLLSFLIKYLVLTIQFNVRKALPDVYQDDAAFTYFLPYDHLREIGFRDEDHTGQMLDRQADMIFYLKQHNSHLSKRILKLTLRILELERW